ncbi:uncharacterized protein RHIMIDRAFT_284493 [Rhizopus microsporus ATCC 52813]|uniref:Uncharacterized protein n=1 Tax=Rhizopus microsporus ATCC 52813 TaxID=1340429 RepID=A0A2G4SU32_RHIZD|nr:uncharacterized protein RHIMIDRAFT_284493 [Rhizopus microsporus ATCC 52813]PHZ12264.1 hypothetical protein RHIMIDRAFT_284493 [Rhizopus microsporus ATCC 52813]
MSKTFNCLFDAFSFASPVVRHPLAKKVALTTYQVLKKLTPILAVALLEVAFLLVEKSAECAGSFAMIMMEDI